MRFADSHADTLNVLAKGKTPVVTAQKLSAHGVALQVLALFTSGADGEPDAREKVAAQLSAFDAFMAAAGDAVSQIRRIPEAWPDRAGVMLSLENCACLCGDVSALDAYAARGVRIASLTWNGANALAGGVGSDQGLTPFGRDVVRRMNKLRVAVDVSHLNDQSFDAVFTAASAPPLATHSCARDIQNHPRNLTREQIVRLCGAGGHIGVNFYSLFLCGGQASSEDIARHVAFIAEAGGAEHIGFGSDFDGIDAYPSDVPGPEGLGRVADALARVGFSPSEIEGIACGNLTRYLKGVING